MPEQLSVDALAGLARSLIVPGRRTLLGITGSPGAGKSTLAAAIVERLDGGAAVAAMDGFHLDDAELLRLGRADRKGAIDTFDGYGFVTAIGRLAAADEPEVYLPRFDRSAELSRAGAVAIGRDVPLVVVEGNYLLVDREPWSRLPAMLDAVWFVDPEPDTRLARLIGRHRSFGMSAAAARAKALGSDQVNADVIEQSRSSADLLVRPGSISPGPRRADRLD